MRNGLSILACVFAFIFFGPMPQTQAQSGLVFGKVIDASSQQGLAHVAVFIPFTSVGTTTDASGNFSLPRLRPGQYNLEIRHLSYKPQRQLLLLKENQDLKLLITLSEKKVEIDEVIKSVEPADWSANYKLFQEFFLGDKQGLMCKLHNPKDLIFYQDGNVLIGLAKKPLQISNRYLGYEVTYYLDYFKYLSDDDINLSSRLGDQYAFEGAAVFASRTSRNWFNTTNWRLSREKEYKGSLRHFLSSLYDNNTLNNHFLVHKIWQGYDDIQYKKQLSSSMLKVKTINIDSIYTWDSQRLSSRFLYYLSNEPYPIGEQLSQAPGNAKLLALPDTLLVLYDPKQTQKREDMMMASLSLSSGRLLFNKEGSILNQEGQIFWKHHDNRSSMLTMIPLDYIPEPKARKLSEKESASGKFPK